MPSDDKLSFLEQLSNALAGQTLTGGARALGEGIGYKYHGGAWSDIPDVMREALERHKRKTANQTKNEQDALAVASGLAAMSNPVSAIGHGIDFAAAVPEMLEYKLSDAEPPIGMIAETGLKRRLQKGGAAADYAMKNQLKRAQQNIQNRGLMQYEPEAFVPLVSKKANWGLGEGKFQAVKDYQTTAYDLAEKTVDEKYIGMGKSSMPLIIQGRPHPLGVEFSNTVGLAPEYQNKGYGTQIYQNMADVYGGGISHSGSTSDAARRVYNSLDAIDTGIPSGYDKGDLGKTRRAIPTSMMKQFPEEMAAFEKQVKEYAEPRKNKKQRTVVSANVQETGRGENLAFKATVPETGDWAFGYSKEDALRNLEDRLPSHQTLRPEQPRQSTQPPLFTPEQNMINEIDSRLMRLGMPRARISGDLVNEVFGNWQNFREQMAARNYDVKYDSVDRVFNITRRQP